MTCPTCNDEGKVLSFYSRGPSSPPGNAYVGCPDCIKVQEYDMAIQHEMDERSNGLLSK